MNISFTIEFNNKEVLELEPNEWYQTNLVFDSKDKAQKSLANYRAIWSPSAVYRLVEVTRRVCKEE